MRTLARKLPIKSGTNIIGLHALNMRKNIYFIWDMVQELAI